MLGTMWARLENMYVKVQLGRDEGQALVEYALILALVSIAAIAVLGVIGFNINDKLTTVKNAI
ncbi:MAG: Flp family type IVb pilin [Actinomycetota bacterium]|nr:Flp family type IVb pilin [Actinomycetota bacterium]